ncbi:ABC transporter substrate-binding protein [Paenibacillus tritici]|uniref:ABC transporter substrate-binding protein n=1 Tax=Paenibacillus tritici TaxID=1873425 RepID=UPI001BA667CD|nr:ABC transporter substrate-binding protein [Paenibacillus tritici]QUL55922.1 ABC transporter substrate-binding protein [Paenibacillus tritici]
MISDIPQSTLRLERLFFSSVHSYFCSHAEGKALPRRFLTHYALCYVTEGKGQLTLNGMLLTANKGDFFLLLPGTAVEGKALTSEPVRYMIIFFSCMQLRKDRRHQELHPPPFPVSGKLEASGQPRAAEIMNQMTVHSRTREPEDILRAKYRLQRLLFMLLQPSERTAQDKAVGMDMVLAHMKNNYNQELRVGQLALMAGLSTNHFIRAFKQLTDKTPMTYLLEERIKKAKQLLFSSERVKQIAKEVGYKDEHYFSRVFKKSEGVAPASYLKNSHLRIAVLYYGLDDYLMTLGLTPVAALSYLERVSRNYALPHPGVLQQDIVRLNGSRLNYEELARLKPDLIIGSDRFLPGEMLESIAPTVVLKHTDNVEQQLSRLSRILGREQQADDWMNSYAEQKHLIRLGLEKRDRLPTVSFIRVSSEFYRLYGASNQTGTLLYRDLGLRPSLSFSEQTEAVDFEIDELPRYNPGYIFLAADPTLESRQRLETLLSSQEWSSLDAVKQSRVFDAGDLLFKTLGPTGRMWAMSYVASRIGTLDDRIIHTNTGL